MKDDSAATRESLDARKLEPPERTMENPAIGLESMPLGKADKFLIGALVTT